MYKITEKTFDGSSSIVLDNITQDIINRFISGPVYGRIKVVGTNQEFTQDDYLKDFKISDLRYVPDQGIFGGAVAKELKINFVNVDKNFSLENKEIEAYLSVRDEENEKIYEIKYGTFIVQHPETEDTTDNTSTTALDYMVKANQPYVDEVEYPCTLRQLTESICIKLGLTLSIEEFRNEDFIVENNQFVGGESYRKVLQEIAKCAFSWARIDENNVLHFDLIKKETIDFSIDIDNYYNLKTSDNYYGPVNRVVIANSQIEGEATKVEDIESIEDNGLTELVIYDSYFAYTQEKREQLIEAGRDLFGFTYMPVDSCSLPGFCFLNNTDKLSFTILNEDTFDTYLFDHIIDYSGSVKDNIETKAMTNAETQYSYTPEMTSALKRTEIIVDKQNQTIEAVVENVGQYDSRITKVEQDIDGIKQLVENAVDYKRTIEGYTQIHLTEAMEEDALSVEIRGNVTYRSDLYPSENLYPSADLYINMEGEELR